MLQSYDGTLLLASHDRYLLDSTTTSTLLIADGSARLFEGNYSAFRRLAERRIEEKPTARPETRSADRVRPRNSFELARARRKAARTVEHAERRVGELEDWLRRIEECLTHPEPDDDMVKLARDHENAQRDLSSAMAAWEETITEAQALGLPI
jgi:ATP-binding cassette subfamily F protein 3